MRNTILKNFMRFYFHLDRFLSVAKFKVTSTKKMITSENRVLRHNLTLQAPIS